MDVKVSPNKVETEKASADKIDFSKIDPDKLTAAIDAVFREMQSEMLGNIFGPACDRCGVRVRMPCSCPWHLRVWDFFLRRRSTIY